MRTHLVTGANSGLGLELTKALAGRGERVVMAVRDRGRGEAARDAVLREHPEASLELASLDLLDLHSVRRLAEQPLELDTLILNAGIGTAPKALSPEGIVTQLAANHFGHFALAGLLYPKLRSGARIVTVSSGFAKFGTLDFENFGAERSYSAGGAYAQSKLANLLFGVELDRRLRAAGASVISVIAHPGIAATEMQQKPTGWMGVVSRMVSVLLARSAAAGVLPILTAATAEGVEGGELWGTGTWASDPPRRETWKTMSQHADGAKLWARSEAVTGVRFLSA